MRYRIGLAAAAMLVVAACSPSPDTEPAPTVIDPAGSTTTTAQPADPEPTTPPTTEPEHTTTSPTTEPEPGWQAPVICEDPCDVEILFTVPVGDDGIGYAGLDQEEMLGWGPSALAVDASGRVWIADQAHNRILAFMPDGSRFASIDLVEYDAAAAADLVAGPDGLLLLDIYVAMQRYRLLELDPEGRLVAAHDLPSGLHLEDGLTGLAPGPAGELWVELESGARIAELDVSSEPPTFTILSGYEYPNGTYSSVPGNTFAYQADDVVVEVATAADLGGLRLLGVNPDGGFVLVLDEVYTGDVFIVDESIHLFDSEGDPLGTAVFPLDEQFVEVPHALTLGPDGYVYGLLARSDHIAIARLPYTAAGS